MQASPCPRAVPYALLGVLSLGYPGCKYQRGAFEEQENDGRWRRCGRDKLRMRVEKGVDVALALSLAYPLPSASPAECYDTVVAITGDGDLEPAFVAARSFGLQAYVCSARASLSEDLRPFLYPPSTQVSKGRHAKPSPVSAQDVPAEGPSPPPTVPSPETPHVYLDELLLLIRGRVPKCQHGGLCTELGSDAHLRRFAHPCPLGAECPIPHPPGPSPHPSTQPTEDGATSPLPSQPDSPSPPSRRPTSKLEQDLALRPHLLAYLHPCPHPAPCRSTDPLHALLFDHPYTEATRPLCTHTPSPCTAPPAPTAAGSLSSSSSSARSSLCPLLEDPAHLHSTRHVCPLGSRCKDANAHGARARRRSRASAFVGPDTPDPVAEHMAAFVHPCKWGAHCRALRDPAWNWEHVLGHTHAELASPGRGGRGKNGNKNRRKSNEGADILGPKGEEGESGLARLLAGDAVGGDSIPTAERGRAAEGGAEGLSTSLEDANVGKGGRRHSEGHDAADDTRGQSHGDPSIVDGDAAGEGSVQPEEGAAPRSGGRDAKTKNRNRRGKSRGPEGPSVLQSLFGSARKVAPEPSQE